MHGLINRSIQCFIQETYGRALWERVAVLAQVDPSGFETMLAYEDSVTQALIVSAARALDRPESVFLEDLGAFLVSIEPLRRLLRFGGPGFADFLMSLDELQSRGQMALPDLELPDLVLEAQRGAWFGFKVNAPQRGWAAVVTGLVRAMADDYGALVLIEAQEPGVGDAAAPGRAAPEYVSVEVLDARFVTGRSFDLTRPETV